MKVQASTILSFVTGRLYSETPPTKLFGPMLACVTGRDAIFTHELPAMKDKHSAEILKQTPPEFQAICNNWQHDSKWKERVEMIDEAFGEFEIRCAA